MDADTKAFTEALKRIPPPLSAFANGAGCPWCGALHQTVTFGLNTCQDCARPFCFGAPDWADPDDSIVSWVEFPHREFDALGRRPELLPPWSPGPVLIALYRQKQRDTARRRGLPEPKDH